MIRKGVYGLLIIALFTTCNKDSSWGILDYVVPHIGTGGHGHTFPGPTLPFGMVQLGPDTRLEGWDGCSGYHYSDTVVYGFSHTHLSGTGVSDYGDVLLMPYTGEVKLENGAKTSVEEGYASRFEKAIEDVGPAYYMTVLTDYQISVSLTATKRTGFHSYAYPSSEDKKVVLDLEHRDKLIDWEISLESETSISGKRISKAWAQEQHIYFVAEFSTPIKAEVWNDAKSVVSLEFEDDGNDQLMIKVGISAVSVENARENLKTENTGWDFDAIKKRGEEEWFKQLSKIEVKGEAEDMVKFYTALYHTMIAPNLYTDVNGEYRGMDMKIHNVNDGEYKKEQYTVFSLWDTFRATHPLYTIIEPDRTNAFIQTFLRQYEQGGLLPVWELAANETNCMIGYHSVPVIADAYAKGIRDYDEGLALEAMQKSAMQDEHGIGYYRNQGCINAGDESESVSKTLAYAYDDWCITEMARLMENKEVEMSFAKRSENWKNLFDPSTGFFRARVNNSWFSPFRPEEVNFNYTEANAWQYSTFVPHDIYSLDSYLPEGLDSHLDNLFSASEETSGRHQADITGLIGQYAHGNEPSHHMAYLYNYVGRPDKTQAMVQRIKEELYHFDPDGLSGNEDCGQMSAWYVLSAIGFYSVTPGLTYYAVGSPTFEYVKINLENGKSFEIEAENLNKKNFYIQHASMNGEDYDLTYLKHEDIMNGGKLIFEMGPEPSEWGKSQESRPPQDKAESELVPVPYFSSPVNTFDDSLRIEISSLCSDCEIWTRIGEFDEWTNWMKNETFLIDQNTAIMAFARHAEKGNSDTIMTVFYKLDDKVKLTLKSEYANQYSAGGDKALIDMQTGTANFRTGRWQGYQGQDVNLELDLGEVKKHGVALRIGFLQDIRSWIWYPEEVELSFSRDGQNWESSVQKTDPNLIKEEGSMVKRMVQGYKKEVRYVRITAKNRGPCPEWHLGSGGDSWIFMDEIEIF